MEINKTNFKIAIIDMYQGVANQGMRCIKELLNTYADSNSITIDFETYDIRNTAIAPDLHYDFYISTGGPGSPIESTGTNWENAFFAWIKNVEDHNNANEIKKPVLFICHSFQLACKYYNIGNLCSRKSTSFGVFPIHMFSNNVTEPVFEGLKNPFYVVDSRDYQVIDPNFDVIQKMGASILAIEKERPHVPLPRAIMAMRFNKYFIGTQFHPEADAQGMSMYFQIEDRKKVVIENHGEAKWKSMVEQLADPEKIMYTYNHIIPNFLDIATGNG